MKAKKKKLRNPFALPGTSPFSPPDLIADELRKITNMLFAASPTLNKDERERLAKDAAEFTHAASEILAVIDEIRSRAVIDRALEVAKKYGNVDNSHLIELQTLRKKQIINSLALACLVCLRQQHVSYEFIERQRNEIKKTRALIARNARDAGSKKIDALVKHHARRRWRENPKRRKSDSGTARDIVARVNEDLKTSGLKVGEEAIRKRIRAFK